MGEDVFFRAVVQQEIYHAQLGVIRHETQVNSFMQRCKLRLFVTLINVCTMCEQRLDNFFASVYQYVWQPET